MTRVVLFLLAVLVGAPAAAGAGAGRCGRLMARHPSRRPAVESSTR